MSIQQEALRATLQNRYLQARSRNQQFTLRAFAKKLELSSGALSEILQGKRNVSSKIAERLAEELQLDPSEKAQIFSPLEKQTARKKVAAQDVVKLQQNQYEVLTDWVHFALLSLLNTKTYKSDVMWIAERFQVPAPRVSNAIKRMVDLGLVEFDGRSRLKRTKMAFRTSDDILNLAIQRSHHGDLDLVRKAIDQVPVELRDLTSITIPTDPQKFAKAKELIREFQDQMLNLMWTDNSTEVYRMNVSLYPLTKPEKK